jgi:fructose 1,6-bisphosphatase
MAAIGTTMARSAASTATGWFRRYGRYTGHRLAEHLESAKLSDVLADLKADSLSQLARDHGAGHLEEKVRTAALD